ncbi:MAG TPA: hypothetical protein VGC42_29395, partial [Kofleriaceae bacterium]
PSLDDPDEDTPLPAPRRDSDSDLVRPRTSHGAGDEAAAMSALAGLSSFDGPVRRVSTAAEQASQAADKLEQAVRRVEAAAEVTVRSTGEMARLVGTPPPTMTPPPRAVARPPVIDIPEIDDQPPVRLKSRALGVISLVVVVAGAIGFYVIYKDQMAQREAATLRDKQRQDAAEAETRRLSDAQADRGTIGVSVTPGESSVWLKLGRTPFDSMPLSSAQLHRIRVERDGYQPLDTEIVAASWEGTGAGKKGKVSVTLKAAALDKKTHKPAIERLPALPPNLAEQTGFTPGEGPVHVETTPPGAEVWLLIGFSESGVHFPTVAGRSYELRALADGYKPGFASISVDEWRDPKGDPKAPIDVAKKKDAIDKHIDLDVDPDAPKKPKVR